MSAVTPWAASARSMPTCIDPKLPPPAKTKAVFPWPEPVPSVPPRNAESRSLQRPCAYNCHATPQAKQGCGLQLAVIASHALVTARRRTFISCLPTVMPASGVTRPVLQPTGRPAGALGALSDGQRHRVHRQQDNDQDEYAAGRSPDPGFHDLVYALVAAGERRGGCCIRGHWLRLLDSAELRLLKLRKTPELKCHLLMMSIA